MKGTRLIARMLQIKDDVPIVLITGDDAMIPLEEARSSGSARGARETRTEGETQGNSRQAPADKMNDHPPSPVSSRMNIRRRGFLKPGGVLVASHLAAPYLYPQSCFKDRFPPSWTKSASSRHLHVPIICRKGPPNTGVKEISHETPSGHASCSYSIIPQETPFLNPVAAQGGTT